MALNNFVLMILLITLLIVIGLVILLYASLWKIFTKAGKPGWAAIIPIYSTYVLSNIVFGNSYYFIACTVAGVISIIGQFAGIDILVSTTSIITILLCIFLSIRMAKAFGKGVGFTIGMVLLPYIFLAILGFGKSEYIGPKKIFDQS